MIASPPKSDDTAVIPSPPPPAASSRRSDLLALLLFLAALGIWQFTTPQQGGFWWSDAPRHALDGAFYRDLARELPFTHLKEFATEYYLQFPALTVLFYPPVFAVIEAVFFGLFGVSHPVAQLSVAFLTFIASIGAYRLLRRWLTPVFSASVVLLFLGLPEVALWGRQIMLELPACTFLFWAAHYGLRSIEEEKPRYFYGATILLLLGIYTKQTVVFLLPVLLLLMLRSKGWALLRSRTFWWNGVIFAVGLLPLAVVTLVYGHVNFNSVAGGSWTPAPVFSVASFTFYLRELPSQAGWPVVVLAGVFLGVAAFHRPWRTGGWAALSLWLLFGYIFFTLIALKEPRHTVVLLLPLAFAALETIRRTLPARIAPVAAMLFAGGVFASTMAYQPVPYIDGYKAASDLVAAKAPKHSTILFSGYRDGSFIFNMRTHEERRDLTVLRADKILLRVTQRRELGVQELGLEEPQILELLDRYGVSYIVNQPNFWDDLEAMQRFQRALARGPFEKVSTIVVTANTGHEDHQLEVYKRVGEITERRGPIKLELPIINVVIEGELGKRVRTNERRH